MLNRHSCCHPSDKKPIPCHSCPVYSASIFYGLKKTALDRVHTHKIVQRYEKKQTIHYQDGPSFGIYCLRSGLVKVFQTTLPKKQYIVRLSVPGDVLGLPTLFTGIPFLWTAETLETATVCFLPREILVPIISENPHIALRLLKILSHFVEESEQKRVELVQGQVRKRLARLLVFLSKNHGAPHPDGIQIRLSLARRELAETIGAAPETTMRLLKTFREEGLLRANRSEMLILDPDRLSRLA